MLFRLPLSMTPLALVAATLLPPQAQAASSGPVVMVPHRAVYDMVLGDARAGSTVTDVQGRMVFEITGSVCEGFTQNMRFVTKMGSAEGQPSVTDLRSTTFEDGAAKSFRFNSVQLRDQKPGDTAVGDATRADKAGELAVELTKPEKKKFTGVMSNQ